MVIAAFKRQNKNKIKKTLIVFELLSNLNLIRFVSSLFKYQDLFNSLSHESNNKKITTTTNKLRKIKIIEINF